MDIESSANTGIIYSLDDPRTGKVRYIGQTIQPVLVRLKQHLRTSITHKTHLGCWLRSLQTCPTITVIDTCKYDELNVRELYWMAYYKNNNLVNSMIGTERSGHYTHSIQSKQKIGASTTERQLGRNLSEETKSKIANSHKGKKLSVETISKIHSARIKNNSFVVSEETRDKLSKAHIGRVFTEEHKLHISFSVKKPIFVYNIVTKEIIKSSVVDFSRLLEVYPNSIQSRLKKYAGKLYKGTYYLTTSEEELKRLLKQIEII